ncbi:MarR family winged helix-turn-helix transcriptional regulator [Frigidibacter sp. MR17.24]|uniref:MarR family winged helix-turn-helix transcriptional regulator n=1 Tax=Frigidibacter sp. MR17.24 TaxID=3127345 RepID=UPI003012D2AA
MDTRYILDEQVGFLLRRVTQRHLSIFSGAIPEMTTTQFAALAKLTELGPLSQNHLGRLTAMDGATIKGVVDRLVRQGMVVTSPDPDDRRRLTVSLTEQGRAAYLAAEPRAVGVTEATLDPLTERERAQLVALLAKMV